MSEFTSSQFGHWQGTINRTDECDLSIVSVLQDQANERGGSLPFLVLASDSRRYWVKPLGNRQGDRILVTEQVVAGCGELIGAPVCRTSLIEIPKELDGDELSNGRILQKGIAHASLDVAHSIFRKHYEPENRDRDDNAYRHAFIFALHDWCWGDDLQWLYQATTDLTTYSHDHGHFLPGGPDWDCEQLVQNVEVPHEIGVPPNGVEQAALLEAASKLDRVTFDQLHAIMQALPESWPVPDTDLEHLGFFLERRASSVSARLRAVVDMANDEEQEG